MSITSIGHWSSRYGSGGCGLLHEHDPRHHTMKDEMIATMASTCGVAARAIYVQCIRQIDVG